MGIPNEYQVDHLFLLVGTNPLPNWVAAQILVRPEHGRLYLVHSSATAPIALRLREPLSALQPELIQVDPTDARSIARTVESHVRPLTGSIGLHYTGGTKAMAVHAYRAMEKTLAGRSPTAVYSYLDAGTFELRVDPDLHEKVLMDVRPTLDQLAALHGARFQKGTPKREKDLHLRKTAAALAASGGLDVWRSGATTCYATERIPAAHGAKELNWCPSHCPFPRPTS